MTKKSEESIVRLMAEAMARIPQGGPSVFYGEPWAYELGVELGFVDPGSKPKRVLVDTSSGIPIKVKDLPDD